eukprot:Nk52_evm19s136 gene=Nk52_evmTU19s136
MLRLSSVVFLVICIGCVHAGTWYPLSISVTGGMCKNGTRFVGAVSEQRIPLHYAGYFRGAHQYQGRGLELKLLKDLPGDKKKLQAILESLRASKKGISEKRSQKGGEFTLTERQARGNLGKKGKEQHSKIKSASSEYAFEMVEPKKMRMRTSVWGGGGNVYPSAIKAMHFLDHKYVGHVMLDLHNCKNVYATADRVEWEFKSPLVRCEVREPESAPEKQPFYMPGCETTTYVEAEMRY